MWCCITYESPESAAGAEIGVVDEHNVLWSPSGSVMGAVSALQSVRSCMGSLSGAMSATGTVVDKSLQPVPKAACRGAEVWSDDAGLVGILQGRPPPLLLLSDSSNIAGDGPSSGHGTSDQAVEEGDADKVDSRSRYFSVAWSDLRVTGGDGDAVGWWCTRRSCVVDEAGEEIVSPKVEEETEGPSRSLPQALGQDGAFLGYVLPTKAVVDRSGHQVWHTPDLSL